MFRDFSGFPEFRVSCCAGFPVTAACGLPGFGEERLRRSYEPRRKVWRTIIWTRTLAPSFSAGSYLHYICKIYEIGEVEGKAFIAMEYVEGRTLQEKLARGPLRLPEILDLGGEIAEAIEAAHSKHIVHRDLKTPNIMIRSDGHVKVMDFGLAKKVEIDALSDSRAETLTGRLTTDGSAPGTIFYMSPEQVKGEPVDSRTDIFSLGVVLYEMATGKLPFHGATSGLAYDAILNHGAVPPRSVNPDVPEDLERIILKALEKDRVHRYQTASELRVDLKRLRRDTDTGPPLEAGPLPGTVKAKKSLGPRVAVVAALLAAAAAILFFRSGPAPESITSLAVLPFENTRNDPEVDYLGDGIAENLINRLSALPKLRVMARSTAFRYRGSDDPQSVGRELNVGAVVTGRVVLQGDSLNVQAELVDVASGTQLWGEQYSRQLADLVTVQNAIAGDISQALRLELTGEEVEQLVEHGTANSEAYRAYLQGRYLWNKRTNEDFKTAIAFFEEAKERDPDYALAYVGLGDSYLLLGAQFYGPDADYPTAMAMEEARASARKALELDPELAEAYVTLAYVDFLYEWDWEAAERDFRKAIELGPEYAVAHQWYAEFLMVRRRHDEAIAEAARALEIEPTSPILSRELAAKFLYARRYPEAIEQLRATLELDASFPLTRGMMVDAYRYSGMRDQTLAELEYLDEKLARLYRLVLDEKLVEASQWIDSFPRDDYSTAALGRYYAMAGDKEKALGHVEEAFRQRASNLLLVQARPDFDPLRSEPRFLEIMRSMGLEE